MTESRYTLKIKPENDAVKQLYLNHGFFNKGDSGIDLFFPDRVNFRNGSTTFVDLKIKCEMVDNTTNKNVSYYLYPRSSISKTSLMLHNSTGIIDEGYRGNIKTAIINTSQQNVSWINVALVFYSIIITNINIIDYELVRIFTFYNLIHILAIFMPLSFYGFITIPKHTRLVQICSPTLESINVEIVTKLSDSERGENGFGSTGTTEIVELSDVDEIDSNDEECNDEDNNNEHDSKEDNSDEDNSNEHDSDEDNSDEDNSDEDSNDDNDSDYIDEQQHSDENNNGKHIDVGSFSKKIKLDHNYNLRNQ